MLAKRNEKHEVPNRRLAVKGHSIYREELISEPATGGRSPGRFTAEEIQRAIRHHRRALKALRGSSAFEQVRYGAAERLIRHLERSLRQLEEELARCAADAPSSSAEHSTTQPEAA